MAAGVSATQRAGEPLPRKTPLTHQGAVHVVVVEPALVARVVGRVDIDALDLACISGQQGLQHVEVIAVDDEVVVGVRRAYRLSRTQTKGWYGTVRWWA